MPLNDAYDFTRDAPPSHQAAFSRSFGVHRILVANGTELCKLTEHGLVNPRNGSITPWWNFVRPTTVTLSDGTAFTDPGWGDSQARARNLGVTDEQFGRARSAVTRQWNKMSGLLQARLLVDAYGWFGRNSGMPLDDAASDPRKVMLIGGAYQVYIPNLAVGMMDPI